MEIEQQPQNVLASVSDLMSGLLFVFMIVLMGFVYQASKEKDNFEKQRKQLEEIATNSVMVRTGILSNIISDFEGSDDIAVDTEGGILRLGQEFLLYPSGATTTVNQENLKDVSESIARVLSCYVSGSDRSDACPKDNRRVEAVFIEGHTDNVPLGRALMRETGLRDNRELSTIRAVHTYNDMLRYAPELADFRNESGQPVISVSGYGPDRPVQGHEWDVPTNDPVNRRIDIRIIMSPFTKDDIQTISG